MLNLSCVYGCDWREHNCVAKQLTKNFFENVSTSMACASFIFQYSREKSILGFVLCERISFRE